jgi:hypothetical protein
VLLVCKLYSVLHGERALCRKPFETGHTYILSCVKVVTVRWGLDWMIGLIGHLFTQIVITSNTALPLFSALYSSLLQTLVSSVYYSLHNPFPGNEFSDRNCNSLTELHILNIAVL